MKGPHYRHIKNTAINYLPHISLDCVSLFIQCIVLSIFTILYYYFNDSKKEGLVIRLYFFYVFVLTHNFIMVVPILMILFVFDSRCLSSSPISIWIIWQVLFKLPVRICFIGMWREGHSMIFLFSSYLEGKQTNYDLYIYVEEWNKWVNVKLERPTSSNGLLWLMMMMI